MKPLKFTIRVDAIDSYIYSGYLFIILNDGRLVYTPLSKIIHKLIEEYPHYESLIRLAFQRNDYFNSKIGKLFLGIGEIYHTLERVWERASQEIEFFLDFCIDDYEVISEIPSMPVLDIKMYAMRMYIGCRKGLYEVKLNPDENKYHISPGKLERCFDAKVTGLNAKSGKVVISANNEGLFHGNLSDRLSVNESPVASKSIRTGWSGYDIINYDKPNEFEYFVNETAQVKQDRKYSKFDETHEKIQIVNLGKEKIGMSQLLNRSELKKEDVIYCFNSSNSGFFFTKEGKFITINIGKEKDKEIAFRSRLHHLPSIENNIQLNCKKPISSSIIPLGCVVEYYDKVVLFQKSKAQIIETDPVMSIRTFINSIRYRNLLSITKKSEISIHSIDPFYSNVQPMMTFNNFDFDLNA